MKKLERQKKAKQLAHAEEVERMKQAAAETGQGYVEVEIPPDEVDENQVKRSLYTSFMTFIPYTNAYYEAAAAEEEMDDLGKMRIETVKASDLYAKTKTGHHEEALQTMMSETNYDFFYFNKLKMKMEAEGKFKFQMPDNRGLFSALDSGPNRNRLRKANNQVYNALDSKITDELQRMSQVGSTGRSGSAGRDHGGDEPCVWRGKSKGGEAMKCENHRFERPTIADPNNPSRKKKKEFFQYCCYHVPFCISELHEVGQNIKIKIPNSQALCAECFMLKNKKRPAPLTNDSAPGVVPVTLLRASVMSKLNKNDNANNSDEERAKERAKKRKMKKVKAANPNQCPWQPTAEEANAEPALRKYECCSDRYKDETTQVQHSHCIWHLRTCIRDHSNDETAMGLITVPNEHGLCMMHYLAEFHDKPPNPPFPFPGMKFRRKKDFWKHDPSRSHWALPRIAMLPHSHHVPPLADVFMREYMPPEPPETVIQKSALWVKMQVYRRRLKREGKRAALIVQKYFRGYRVRNMQIPLIRLIDQREIKLRLFNSIIIQTQMRRFLAAKHVVELRAKYNRAATVIESLYRGSVVRAHMRRLRAAKRIKKFMKRLHFFKFRDAVILIMSIRRMFRKRNTTAMMVQRVYRGYRGRVFVFYQRLWGIVHRAMKRVLKRALTAYVFRFRAWKKLQNPWRRPSEEVLRSRLVKRLAILLTKLVHNQHQRRLQHQQFVEAMQPMQALARGYLARIGMQNLRRLRKQLTAWVTGEHPDQIKDIQEQQELAAQNKNNFSAMELVMKMVRHHRTMNYKVPPNIQVIPSVKQVTYNLAFYQERQKSLIRASMGGKKGSESTSHGMDSTTNTAVTTFEPGREFWFIRKYVPPPYCFWPEIDKKKQFLPALQQWYQDDQHLSLMSSEQDALIRRFTNRVNNKIMVEVLDMYIAQHPLPCRKHGRRVCGTCFYRRHCLLPSCHCQCYSKKLPPKTLSSTATADATAENSTALTTTNTSSDKNANTKSETENTEIALPTTTTHHLGICVQCDHPINMHSICPLQYPKPFTSSAMMTKKGRPMKPTAVLEAQLEYLEEDEIREELLKLRNAKNALALSVAPSRVDVSGASIGSMLDILRTVNEPDMSMPIGVFGVNAEEVVIPALTYQDERMYQEDVTHRQAKRLQRLLRRHFTNKAAMKATAKTTQGSALEKQLKLHGIQAALQSPVIQSLSSTIALQHKLQQTFNNGGDMTQTALGIDNSVAEELANEVLHAAESLLQGKSSHLLIKEISSMQLEGNEIALNNTYWEEDTMPSAIVTHTENSPMKTHLQDFLQPVTVDAHVPEPRNPDWAKPSNPRFWEEVVAKNPNKSATDYHEGFEHNMPVPFLLPPKHRVGDSKEIVYTFEGGKLYYNILWQIIELAESVESQITDTATSSTNNNSKSSSKSNGKNSKKASKLKNLLLKDVINPDYSPFLSLVMNHIQIFERHWRKMVADLRGGCLDHHLYGQKSISEEAKTVFEATQIPRPALAEQLDLCFRALGFHKKVLGKDIDIKPLAKKKTDLDKRRSLQRAEQEGKLLRGEIPPVGTADDSYRRNSLQSSSSSSKLRRQVTLLPAVSQSVSSLPVAGSHANASSTVSFGNKPPSSANRTSHILAPRTADTTSLSSKPNTSQSVRQPSAAADDSLFTGSRNSSPERRRRNSLPMNVEADTASRPVTALLVSGTTSHPSSATVSSRTLLPPLSMSSTQASNLSPPKSPPKSATKCTSSAISQRDLFLKSLTMPTDDHALHGDAHRTHQEELFTQAITLFEPENQAERALLASSSSASRVKTSDKRRKSASQIQMVPTATLSEEQVHAIHYDLMTDARDKQGYDTLVQLASTGRFVCPFPACGVTFLTAEVGFRHLQEVHGQQTRLFAATPQTDAVMRFYWPKVTGHDSNKTEQNPWQIHAKSDRIPPGSIVCPVPTCRGQAFATRNKWEAHLRIVHHIYHWSHEKQNYWSVTNTSNAHVHQQHPAVVAEHDGHAQQDETGGEETFHVTSAMQQQDFHRHGGAKVLKTIPPDHTQPLFDNHLETHEYEYMSYEYGEDTWTKPMFLPDISNHADAGSTTTAVSKPSIGSGAGKLAALKHRASYGFSSVNSATSSQQSSAVTTTKQMKKSKKAGAQAQVFLAYINLVHYLRHPHAEKPPSSYYPGIGHRTLLPNYCLIHQSTSSHCLQCLHADADYNTYTDGHASAQQLRERCDMAQVVSSHNQSVYYARPHAPYQIHYSYTIHLMSLILCFQKSHMHEKSTLYQIYQLLHASNNGGKNASNTSHTKKSSNAMTKLPNLLRTSIPLHQPICLLHGDDQHILLVQRDLYHEYGIDILTVLPPALRSAATSTSSNIHLAQQNTSYRLQNAALWPAHFLVRPMFLVEDRDKIAWIGCEPVFLPQQLQDGDQCDILNVSSSTAAKQNKQGIRIFDRETEDDQDPVEYTDLFASSMTHELLTATALLTHYDSRIPESSHQNFAGMCALLSSSERLLWLPLHCTVAAFKVRYIPAPPRPEMYFDDASHHSGSDNNNGKDNNNSSYHARLAAEELAEEEEMLTPLSRWKIRQEAIFQASSSSSSALIAEEEEEEGTNASTASIAAAGKAKPQLVPSLRDIAPARFFIRI